MQSIHTSFRCFLECDAVVHKIVDSFICWIEGQIHLRTLIPDLRIHRWQKFRWCPLLFSVKICGLIGVDSDSAISSERVVAESFANLRLIGLIFKLCIGWHCHVTFEKLCKERACRWRLLQTARITRANFRLFFFLFQCYDWPFLCKRRYKRYAVADVENNTSHIA
jgi:hypothetical protein